MAQRQLGTGDMVAWTRHDPRLWRAFADAIIADTSTTGVDAVHQPSALRREKH